MEAIRIAILNKEYEKAVRLIREFKDLKGIEKSTSKSMPGDERLYE